MNQGQQIQYDFRLETKKGQKTQVKSGKKI